MADYSSDNFTRANQSGWGTASENSVVQNAWKLLASTIN